MPLQGTLVADFASFYEACQKADVSLATFEASAGKVEDKLEAMTNSLSGVKIVQQATLAAEAVDRIGGVSKLTEAELSRVSSIAQEAAAKLRAMGQDVPPGIQQIADATSRVGTTAESSAGSVSTLSRYLLGMVSIGALISFGRQVLEAGSHIQKMASQMEMTNEQVQRLSFVAGQSDVSIESLVGAVQNLQQRLGDETSGAAGAFAKLGIQTEAFRKLGTYDQLMLVSTALRAVKDPTDFASEAAALFGKTWKEIGPVIRSEMDAIAERAPLMSDATITSLDRIDDKLKQAKATAIGWGAELVTQIEQFGYNLGGGRFFDEINRMQVELNDELTPSIERIGRPILAVNDGLKSVAISATQARMAEAELTEQVRKAIYVHEAETRALEAKNRAILAEFDALAKVEQELSAFLHPIQERVRKQLDDATAATLRFTNEGVIQEALAIMKLNEELRMMSEGLTAVTQASTTASAAVSTVASAAVSTVFSFPTGISFGPTGPAATTLEEYLRANWDRLGGSAFNPFLQIQGRAGGGSVSAGSSYLVGERGQPELFTPGASGFVTPLGSGTINLYVTQPLGTPDAIARAVSDALTNRLRTTGARLSSGA